VTRFSRCRLPRSALSPCIRCGRRCEGSVCSDRCREALAEKALRETEEAIAEEMQERRTA
jgi:hypothetical protein